jgi:ribonucleoside-diphosphate reductase alpha chain
MINGRILPSGASDMQEAQPVQCRVQCSNFQEGAIIETVPPMGIRHDTPRLSPNARTVLRQRYLAKNERGVVIESPSALFHRVADDIASLEPPAHRCRLANQFYEAMASLTFLPNSPTLMNAGRPLQQLSACFVLPIDDSLESIFDAVKYQALIHQSGGGTGFSFSQIRPHADRVATTNGLASGPISFMRLFNLSTDVIKQGGTRRGANMGILRVDHPDILAFIELKLQPHEMENFNLSVGLTDRFMKAVTHNRSYALINPRSATPVRRLPARMVFDRLVEAAWQSGEPGVLFLDTINRANPTPHLGTIEATNPCGEQPLLAYESCTLRSINVARCLTTHRGACRIDYERLGNIIPLAVRFLDNVLERTRFLLPSIEAGTKRTRKIGLGIMGFADLLIQLEIPYDTDEALHIADQLMGFVRQQAHEASRQLALERGHFPAYKGSRLEAESLVRRNATVTTIAPTGSISILADCSAGIEPLYGISVAHTIMEDIRLQRLHPEFLRQARARHLPLSELREEIGRHESIQHLSQIPDDLRRLFVTAHDITPAHHVRMQAVFQRHSDSGVSKTINLPSSATMADVAAAFMLAYELGCKGLTVYRTGSRAHQVLSCSHVQSC